MIVIKHLTGPLAGQEQTFKDDRDRIVIGRDPDLCQVVYPADYTIVGREHVAFVRELSGDYEVDLFGDHYVEIGGTAAEPGQPLPQTTTLRLGGKEGPTFLAVIEQAADAKGLPETGRQEQPPPVRRLSERARRFGLVAALGALVAVLGVGGLFYARQKDEEEQKALAARVTAQVDQMIARQRGEAAERIAVKDRERLARSVYAVVLRDKSGREALLGTAWAVAPNLLATNAHVAAEFFRLGDGGSMLVRPPGSAPVSDPVTRVAIHPGYVAFAKFLGSDPFYIPGAAGTPRLSVVPGYDVALLQVQNSLPADAVLTIAPRDVLAALMPGAPVAFAGYPYERVMGDDLQPIGRTPQFQAGNITALTDNFLLPADPAQRRIVQHSLPATGGASGSPIIDASGRVIALLSAGNIFSAGGGRLPNAVQINYGQRADVLLDLLEGHAAERLAADRAHWDKQAALFKRGIDVLIPALLDQNRPAPDAKAIVERDSKTTVTTQDRFTRKDENGNSATVRFKTFPLTLKGGSQHYFVAYAENSVPIVAMSLIVGDKIVARDRGGSDQWAAFAYTAPPTETKAIAVVETDDKDTAFTFRDYVWQRSGS